MNDDSTNENQSEVTAPRFSFYFEGSPSLFLSTVLGIASAREMTAGEVRYGQEVPKPSKSGMQVFPSTERLRDPNKIGVIVRPRTIDEKRGYLRLVGYAQPGDRTLVVDESQFPDRWMELRTWLYSELAGDGHIVEADKDVLKLTPRQNNFADLVADGWTLEEVAERMVISSSTAKSHKDAVTAKVKEVIGWSSQRSMTLNELSAWLKSFGFGSA